MHSLDHTRFEELCALAAGDELTPDERCELDDHLAACGQCRQLHADFVRLCARELPLAAAAREAVCALPDDSLESRDESARYYDRFQRRLAREHAPRPRRTWLWIPAAAALVVAAFLTARGQVESARNLAAAERARRLELEASIGAVENQARTTAQGRQDLARTLAASEARRAELEDALAQARARQAGEQAAARELGTALAAARRRSEELERNLESAKAQSAELGQNRKDLEARLQLSLGELRRLRQAQAEAADRAGQQAAMLAGLRLKLESAESELERAANRRSTEMQAADLFAARDLHIVDVYDVDSKGNTKRTFGRVYYIEKKLLIFYAFDLHEKRRDHKTAVFQAWGYREAAPGKPHSLGLFQADNQAPNRWVLKVDNPKVLSQIDIVFVTLESRLGRTIPSGHRLLYANLTGPPNHP